MGMGGAMDSCGRCMKISLIGINVITFVAGAIVLGAGVWVWTSRSFSSSLMNNNMYIASMAVVVATGAFMMVLSILGCCAAAKEVKCMLLTYYILVLIIFVAMMVGGILQFVFRERVVSTLEREMHASIPYYGQRDGQQYTAAWDNTQTYLQCCGVKNLHDWNGFVPTSCCREIYPGQRQDCQAQPNPTNTYSDGCKEKLEELLRENAVKIGSIAIAVALLMLLGLVLSCGLFVKIE